RFEDAGLAEERAHRVGGLRAVVEPVIDPCRIEVERLFALTRGVLAEDLDEAPVARALRVGDDDAIEGLLFPPGPAETNLHGHCTVLMRVLVLRRAHRVTANRPCAPGNCSWIVDRDCLRSRPAPHGHLVPNIFGRNFPAPPGRLPAFFIIFCISRNCSSRRFTSLIGRPEPLATRARREPFMMSCFFRSVCVIDRTMASTCLRRFGSACLTCLSIFELTPGSILSRPSR